jgi:uncharacterized protein with HEPN domain
MIPLVADRSDEIAELCRKHQVQRLDLFGSAATGASTPKQAISTSSSPSSPKPTPPTSVSTTASTRTSANCSTAPSTWSSTNGFETRNSAGRLSAHGLLSTQPRTRRYLQDIIETAKLIQESTAEKTFNNYEADIRLRHEIERELMIVGEALARLENLDSSLANKITDYNGYIGLRNILNHRYPDIEDALVWRTIESEIPILIREYELLLDNFL